MLMPYPFLAALILAGGQSSRMGTDKAQMLWSGLPLLQRVYQAASACCSPIYLLTPWPKRYQGCLLDQACIFLVESQPGEGPLVALNQGLLQISQPWILLLACDMPCLDPQLLQEWAGQLDQLPDSQLALVPQHLERWQPLCGFYRCQSQPSLQQFITQGGRSLQAWLNQAPVQALPITAAESRTLWNCNTPEDLETAAMLEEEI
jgi:molybdopterin-guanine dinucleotide biosynthesis protein A